MAGIRWLLALLVAPTTVAVSAPNAWTLTGPEGGPASSIEYAGTTPGVALAAAGNAIYRTEDSGTTWVEVRTFGTTNDVSFARDPSNPRLLAVGPGGAPLRSDDGGETFAPMLPRFVTPNGSSYESAVAIAGSGAWYGGTSSGAMLVSTDQGATWAPRNQGLSADARAVRRILLDPRNPDHVHALIASPFANLYSSTNGGVSWVLHSGTCGGTGCADVALNPHAPDELLAAGSGLHSSSDSGQTWTQRDPRVFSAVRFDPLVPGRVLALTSDRSITRSTDGGKTWPFTTPLPITSYNDVAAAIAFDPLQAGLVLVGTGQGVLLSEDAGTTWVERNAGINGAIVRRLVSQPPGATAARVVAVGATTRPGLLAYGAPSRLWSPLGSASLLASAPEVHVLSFDYVDAAPDTLYAGGYTGGFFRSDDAGATWNKTTTGLDVDVIFDIASASSTQSVYVASGLGKVQYSGNGGVSFVSRSAGLPSAGSLTKLILDRDNDNALYALLLNATPGIYRTLNGGVSWTAVDGGIGSVELYDIAVDPENFAIVYAATATGLAKSIDSGDTWTFLPGNHFVGFVAVDHYDGAHLIRASYQLPQRGFERSVDGGQTWELVGRAGSGQSRGVAFDYTTPSSLMTIVDLGGVATIQIAPDLEVTSSSTAVAQSSPRTVEVDVRNRGPYAASHVVLTASVPRTGATAQTQRGQCTVIGATGSVRCDVGIVRADENVAVTFALPELSAGDAAVRFEAAGREPDVDSANNELTLGVERQSDVAVTVSTSAASVVRDQAVTFTLNISNGDFSPAEDVRFNVMVPASLELGALSPTPDTCIGTINGRSCLIGALARHSSTEIRVTATARQIGPATVSASVTSQGIDPLPGNNSATATVNVAAPPPPASTGGGGGGGSFSFPFVLLLAGLAACRRRGASH
jgi:photosystem II stability/assembly factor-like uncharacterized protein